VSSRRPDGSAPEGPTGYTYDWVEDEPADAALDGPRPTFFVVGNPKAGTTTLFLALESHPDVFIPPEKELNHFATDLTSAGDPFFPPSSLPVYLSRFAAAEPTQVCGDISPAYASSTDALDNIARFEPAARIVVIFREPVATLRSVHQQLLRAGIEDEHDLATALALEPERRAGRHVPDGVAALPRHLFYRERVDYRLHLDRIDAAFPPDQVLVLLFDDLADDFDGTMARVHAHIGVEHLEGRPRHGHRGRTLRSAELAQRLEDPASTGDRVAAGVTRGLRRLVPRRVRTALVRSGRHPLHRAPPPVPPALAASLRAEVRPAAEVLSQRLGVDVVARWGYDRDT
jgi:hypothetical protein